MIELVYGDDVIEMAEEITIHHYQEITNKQILYEKNPNMLISLFTGLPFSEIKNMQKDEIDLINKVINTKFVIPKENELVLTFMYDGIEYGLENDWSKLAWGAWVDFEVYSAENIINNIHLIMAILYRPIISKDKKNPKKYKIAPYKSEEIEERGELFKELPCRYWLGASGFFFQIVNLYIDSIKSSLESQNKMNKLIQKGWMILPKFLKKRLPLDSILSSPTNLQKKN